MGSIPKPARRIVLILAIGSSFSNLSLKRPFIFHHRHGEHKANALEGLKALRSIHPQSEVFSLCALGVFVVQLPNLGSHAKQRTRKENDLCRQPQREAGQEWSA